MKKQLLFLIILAASMITSCKKKEDKDVTVPTLTLKGKSLDWVYAPKEYVDPGATATDDKDGDITRKVVATSSIDYTHPNITYDIDYEVRDSAGNPAPNVVRLVMLIQLSTSFAAVTNGGVAGSQSWTDNLHYFIGDSLTFDQFAGFVNGHVVAVMTNDTVFTIAPQTVVCGDPPATPHTFSGSGTLSHARSGPSIRTTIEINYSQVLAGATTTGTITYKN